MESVHPTTRRSYQRLHEATTEAQREAVLHNFVGSSSNIGFSWRMDGGMLVLTQLGHVYNIAPNGFVALVEIR